MKILEGPLEIPVEHSFAKIKFVIKNGFCSFSKSYLADGQINGQSPAAPFIIYFKHSIGWKE